MADETIGTYTNQIVQAGYNPNYIAERKIGGSDIYPGLWVTGSGESSNYPQVDLCASGEGPLGIALEHFRDDGLAGTIRDTESIDTAYTNGANVRVAQIGSGMQVYSLLSSAATAEIEDGDKLTIDTTSDGYLAPYAYGASGPTTADIESAVGKAAMRRASAVGARVILVNI